MRAASVTISLPRCWRREQLVWSSCTLHGCTCFLSSRILPESSNLTRLDFATSVSRSRTLGLALLILIASEELNESHPDLHDV